MQKAESATSLFAELASAASGLPTLDQQRLFRAIFGDEAAFPRAFDAWTAGISLAEIDRASLPLTAMLHARLAKLAGRDEWKRLSLEQYRRNWLRNAITYRRLEGVLARLAEAKIEALVLKGAALIDTYYGDRGLRPMIDFDLLVREEDFHHAAALMQSVGWSSRIALQDFDDRFAHALTLVRGDGTSVDLHCHALLANTRRAADQPFWDASLPLTVGSVQTRTLCASHHVMHVAAHGMVWRPVPAVRWVADILTLAAKAEIDWEEVADRAVGHGVTVHVGCALAYLAEHFELAVPEAVLRRLAGAKRPAADMLSIEPLANWLRFHWHATARSVTNGQPRDRLRLLPAYLRYLARKEGKAVLPWAGSQLLTLRRRARVRAR